MRFTCVAIGRKRLFQKSKWQTREVALRAKALDSLLSTPHSLRRRAFTSLNICLRDRNIAPLPESLLGGEDF